MVALNIPVICVKSARYLDTTAEQATNIIMLYVSLYMGIVFEFFTML